MRHAIRRQRLACAAVGLAMAAAAAGCSQVAPTQASGPAGTHESVASFQTQQVWLGPALAASGGLLTPAETALSFPLGLAEWGRPFAAGYGYPLILPQSSLWVGSGIELLIGTWPFRSILYGGV
jgi:hypothetical protein